MAWGAGEDARWRHGPNRCLYAYVSYLTASWLGGGRCMEPGGSEDRL
jgi:hypothetical protein